MKTQNWEEAEEKIFDGLRKLTTEGGDHNFMIVSAGDVYVQFAGTRGSTQLDGEAVSNAYLPPRLQLSSDQVAELERLDFDIDDSDENFSRKFDVSDEPKARDLAQLTLKILATVYGCVRDSKLGIQLKLE